MSRVYFIKPIGMDGPIKIGCSFSPERRRDALETWAPFPLEIVAEIDGDDRLERRFHARFLPDRTHREWFKWSADLQAVIDAIADGRFDVSSLPEPVRLVPARKPGAREGVKWSEERKARARRHRAIARAERESGLVLDWADYGRLADAFIANPSAYGITVEERIRRGKIRGAQMRIEDAQATLRAVGAA